MAEKSMEKLEELVRNSELDEQHKQNMLEQVGNLKQELEKLEDKHGASAKNIAGKAHESTEKAIRGNAEKKDGILEESLDSLQESVSEFEASHPKLTQTVNRICMMLSDMGI